MIPWILLIVSATVVVYTIAIYPALLAVEEPPLAPTSQPTEPGANAAGPNGELVVPPREE